MGKEICFHKIGLIMMPKRKGYKISTIFLFARLGDMMTKNWYNPLQNLILELVTRDIHHADKYWIRPKMSVLR